MYGARHYMDKRGGGEGYAVSVNREAVRVTACLRYPTRRLRSLAMSQFDVGNNIYAIFRCT